MTKLSQMGIDATSLSAESDMTVSFRIPMTLSCFDGHFPGNPMLPAFAALEISLAMGKDLKLFGEDVKKISQAKFLAPLKPGDHIRVLINQDKISTDFQWQQEVEGHWKKACEINVVI